MIDKSKFRFRIGDTVEFRGANHKVKAYYFSEGFNNYVGAYGYTIDYPQHDGSCYSYDECGNKMSFPKGSMNYVIEAYVTSTKRTIEVTLELAQRWYSGDNGALRSLALTVYTEDELNPNTYDAIASKVCTWDSCIQVPEGDVSKVAVYHKLLILASYFNKGWTMKAGSVGFFISKDEYIPDNVNRSLLSRKYNHKIANHNTVMQAGIVYFKNGEDVVKAYKILGEEEIEGLFR